MGFTINEQELKKETAKKVTNTLKKELVSEKKEFYSFLQKLNLQTEMGME